MRLTYKVLLWWSGLLAAYGLCLYIFPHSSKLVSAHLNQIMQSLLFMISIFIFLKEPNRKNKFVFLNFILYFSLAIAAFMHSFVGKAFLTGKYDGHLFFQYLSIAYVLVQTIAVVYLTFDLLFREFRVYQKYLFTLIVVLAFFIPSFYQFFTDPLYLYRTEDIKQWKTLDTFISANPEVTNPIEISNKVTLQAWQNGKPVADLYDEENLRRIEYLLPYLDRGYANWQVLLFQPMFKKIIVMDVLILGFILLFFGYQYKKDPPQGAYIDKIMFLILLLSSMDILHIWEFIKSVEWGSMKELFTIGQYITVFAEVMMVLFFFLRLRFITSVQGEYYETELAANPEKISRWRDSIDNLVLSQFFNLKIFHGRLFQNPDNK